jgi:hypothetical protein
MRIGATGLVGDFRKSALRDRAKTTSAILAWPFARWLRCTLLTDPLAGYARRSRLASGQNSCAIITEFIFARSLNRQTWKAQDKFLRMDFSGALGVNVRIFQFGGLAGFRSGSNKLGVGVPFAKAAPDRAQN